MLFKDGIVVSEAGDVVSGAGDAAPIEAAKRTIDRLVRAYVKGYCEHLVSVGQVEEPGTGDCFFCVMRTVDGGVPLGDALNGPTGNVDHLLSHLEERYFVPALLINAIEARRYGGGVGFIVQMINASLERRNHPNMAGDNLRAYFRSRKLALAELLISRADYERHGE